MNRKYVVLNQILALIPSQLDITDNSSQDAWQKIEFIFGKAALVILLNLMIECADS